MIEMNRQEIQELLALLDDAGMKPMLCDCPVQYYDVDVHAGMPTGIGEPERGEYMMLPRELVGLRPVLWDEKNVPVTGKRFEAYLRIAKDTASRLME